MIDKINRGLGRELGNWRRRYIAREEGRRRVIDVHVVDTQGTDTVPSGQYRNRIATRRTQISQSLQKLLRIILMIFSRGRDEI